MDSFVGEKWGRGGEFGSKERGNLDSFAIIYWAAFAALGLVIGGLGCLAIYIGRDVILILGSCIL